MIVYGDPHYDVPLASMLEGLRSTLRTAIDRADGSLATARFLLIFAGQLEQAAFDAAPLAKSSELLETIHGATRYLGRAFYSAWAHHGWSNVLPSFTSAYSLLSDVDCKLEVVLTVKLPEGYSFYALYPEQYCNAALRWIKDHEQAAVRIAAVVGIRSIGTSAAAAVTATLEASGWHVGSFTVRPQGDPFNRETLLDPLDINSSALCIIVDEGPGISGSSMASVGDALFREGIQPGQISFMPGSSSEPGSAASDYVREWWRRTPRYPASFPDRPQSGAHPPGIAEGSINS
ncbi:MAG TPA: hypothetical protein VM409_06490, partial [Chloroflexia bacterium]|nr:hypothetical protein [Chloroflexia bacterium]